MFLLKLLQNRLKRIRGETQREELIRALKRVKHDRFAAQNRALAEETAHRKQWLSQPVRNKRYIRGVINQQIKDRLHNRRTNEQTTDPAIRAIVLAKTGGRCFYCHRLYTRDIELAARLPRLYFSQLEIDHLVPISKFGPNAVSNYVPACHRCNSIKSDLSLGAALEEIRKAIQRAGY